MWITRRRAAELLECGTTTVDRLIETGQLHPRTGAPPRTGSLNQDEVLALAAQRQQDRDDADRARRARERRLPAPPDTDHEWLTASQAARVAQMSPMGIYKRVSRGTIPSPTTRADTGSAEIRLSCWPTLGVDRLLQPQLHRLPAEACCEAALSTISEQEVMSPDPSFEC
jgi:hypothetical protein